MDTRLTFLLGVIGALAPEIVRLYSIRTKQFKWSWFYLIISVLFACLGGVIAMFLPTVTYWGAFYAGISTPVFVNKILEKGMDISQPELKGPGLPFARPSFLRSFVRGL